MFVDPQEVSDLVSSVISTHNCEPSCADLQLSCDRYDTYGLLEEALLDDMLERCGRLHRKEVILGLLKKFDLAVEFDAEENTYEVPKSGRVFVVPSMLVYNKIKVYQKQDDDVIVLSLVRYLGVIACCVLLCPTACTEVVAILPST